MTAPIIPKISGNDFDSCPKLPIIHCHWHTIVKPSAWAKIALSDSGCFLVQLFCDEHKPLKTFRRHFDKVYFDSALEAFFQFIPQSPFYFNFEFNAFGTALIMYGDSRNGRCPLSSSDVDDCRIKAYESEDGWAITFCIPFSLIQKYQPEFNPKSLSSIRANFYKLSENRLIEHYMSYAPVKSAAPNFHLPQYFADFPISQPL